MWSRVVLYLMLLHAASVCSPGSYGTDSLAEKGQAELFHVRRLANQPRYGECWARALVDIEASCRELTEERQSRMALKFTHCHLHRYKHAPAPTHTPVNVYIIDVLPYLYLTSWEIFTKLHLML